MKRLKLLNCLSVARIDQRMLLFLNEKQKNQCRFPSLFVVDTFRHFGRQILNSQIRSP
jgi:hypothetical protein